MNTIFQLDLYQNPIKLSKIKRVYGKINQTNPLVYNILNDKIEFKEFKFLLENESGANLSSNPMNEELSKKISKESGQLMMVFDGDQYSNLIIIYNDEPHKQYNTSFTFFDKEYTKIGILDHTSTLSGNLIIQVKDILKKLVDYNQSGYNNFYNYTSTYFDYNSSKSFSLEYAMYCQKNLNWSDELLEKFRKDSKLYPGDVCPSKKESKRISNDLKFIFNADILEGELKYLMEQIELLYLKIDGRFPNKEDLKSLINNSHFKNKEQLISLIDLNPSKPKLDIDPSFVKFYTEFNTFIEENKEQNPNASAYYRVSGAVWNQAFLINKIEEFYQELIKLSKNGYSITIENSEHGLYPHIYIFFDFKKSIKNLDFSIFSHNMKS